MNIPIWLLLIAAVLICWRCEWTRGAILWALVLGFYVANSAAGEVVRNVGSNLAGLAG
jgi:hypothetical protein